MKSTRNQDCCLLRQYSLFISLTRSTTIIQGSNNSLSNAMGLVLLLLSIFLSAAEYRASTKLVHLSLSFASTAASLQLLPAISTCSYVTRYQVFSGSSASANHRRPSQGLSGHIFIVFSHSTPDPSTLSLLISDITDTCFVLSHRFLFEMVFV